MEAHQQQTNRCLRVVQEYVIEVHEIIITMRKFQQSDRVAIERLRAHLKQQQESIYEPDCQSTFDQSCYDEFHNQFLKYHRIKNIKISYSNVVNKNQDQKQYTEYSIEVTTDELVYSVSRRFRQFYSLYKKIKKLMPKQCSFPRKNYNPFISSVSPNIIEQRIHKLNMFLNEILHQIISHKQPLLTLKLFNFIELKETYQDKFMNSSIYHKSNSQKMEFSRYHSIKGHSSQKSLSNFSQNSLQLLILLINQPTNPGKHLGKLQEIIRNKKFKASLEEIKLIFMGFDQYQGLLQFGLTNSLQSNRIKSLQILVDLLLPQRNILFQKYEKMLEKVAVEFWIVQDISFLDSSEFKILYFRLLSIYCERADKDQYKGEKFILRSLFMFHQNLMNDYFDWKTMNNKTTNQRRRNSRSMPDPFSSSWSHMAQISDYSDPKTVQMVETQSQGTSIYYNQPKNILILTLNTAKSLDQIVKQSYNWNKFVESYQMQEFTGHYRYVLKNKGKNWNIKMKISQTKVGPESDNLKNTVLPDEFDKTVKESIQNSTFKISRQQSLFDYYPDYEQEIWIRQLQSSTSMVIVIKISRDVDIFSRSIRPWATVFAQDAATSF